MGAETESLPAAFSCWRPLARLMNGLVNRFANPNGFDIAVSRLRVASHEIELPPHRTTARHNATINPMRATYIA